MSESKKITLMSSDGERFEVNEAVAREFKIVAHMIEDGCVDGTIPIANVTSTELAKVIEYSKKHVEAGAVEGNEAAKTDLKKWDEDVFLKSLDEKMLYPLTLAANYLNIKGLLDLLTQKIADHIKDLQPADVRTLFNIENDFTPEEEAQMRKENEWAFE